MITPAVLPGDLADLSTRTLLRGAEPTVRGIGNLIDVFMTVDSSEYDGVSCRTVSGWKHSSTKAILAGVISLKSRLYTQNQFLYISIGSGTAFSLEQTVYISH